MIETPYLLFLGDAVLGLCVGHLLMESAPLKKEGDLSRLRSNLVSETGLAYIARRIDLGRFIKLGKGEFLSGGSDKNSILSDVFLTHSGELKTEHFGKKSKFTGALKMKVFHSVILSVIVIFVISFSGSVQADSFSDTINLFKKSPAVQPFF